MKALYRKYRPTTLKDVVGQKQVTDVLESSLKKGKVSHAYLFTGPRGCGKTSVARIFAHEINGFKYELEDFYPDIIEIDAASNTGVENIRDLREKAIIAPSEGKYKVYIIDEVHMLSKSAFNALLKTLEEPPEHVVFIMATTDAYKVPITITSRSQTFKFELSTPDIMLSHLEKIAKAEKINIEKEALEIIVRRGGGSFRDSISLLDQISTIKDGKITSKILEESLGLPKDTKISSLLDSYKSGNLAEISENLKTLLNENIKPELIAEEIIEHILENPTLETLPLLKTLVEVSFPFAEAKLLLAFTESLAVKPAAQVSIQTQIQAPIQAQTQAKPQVETKAEKAKSEESTKTKLETEPEPEPEPEPETEPETETEPKQDQSNAQPEETGFTWQSYLDSIRQASPSNAKILESCNYKISGTSIIVTTDRKIYKTILESANNIKVLKEKLPENYSLNILGPDDVISTEDPQISKLSAIMGGNIMEVKENAGDSPF